MNKTIDIVGEDNCVCLAPPQNHQLHGFIVKEIRYHFKQLAGLDVKISHDNAVIRFQLVSRMPPDAFQCREQRGMLIIAASNQRGLYYGIMTFFEKLGCRHFAPGEENSVIPRLRHVRLPGGWHAAGNPALRWRGYHICGSGLDRDGEMIWHYDYDTALFMIRNRLNFKPIHNDEYDDAVPLLDSMLLSSLAFGHSYSEWIPESEFVAHPDFFPLIDGKRISKGQLCLSNEKLQELVARRVIEYLRNHPNLEAVSLAPNDGYVFCECANCLALDSASDRQANEINRRNHYFAARIAEKVREVCPGRMISIISYCNYKDPGEDIPYQPNLAISICTDAENLIEYPLAPTTSPSVPEMSTRIEKWRVKVKNIFWSDYLLGYGGTFPRPYAPRLAKAVEYLVEHGVAGFKSEVTAGRSPAWQSAMFLMYAVSRLLYDASLDVDRLLRDFCEKFYGTDAASEILEYYRLHHQIIDSCPRDVAKLNLISDIYSDADIIALGKPLDHAISMTTDEPYLSRVTLLKKQFDELVCSRRSLDEATAENVPLRIVKFAGKINWNHMADLPLIQLRHHDDCSRYDPENAFSLAYNERRIYLYFKLGEADMPTLHKFNQNRPLEQIPAVCTLSNIDCFLAPAPATGVYYQIMVNARGEYYSARCHDKTWDSGYDLKPEIHRRFFQNRWELLVGIDFVRLATDAPAFNEQWKASVNRHYGRYVAGQLGGWPRGGVWHDIIQSGGTIIFDILASERLHENETVHRHNA